MIGIGGDNLMQLSQISDDELVDIFTEIGMIGRDSNIFVSLLTVKSKRTLKGLKILRSSLIPIKRQTCSCFTLSAYAKRVEHQPADIYR